MCNSFAGPSSICDSVKPNMLYTSKIQWQCKHRANIPFAKEKIGEKKRIPSLNQIQNPKILNFKDNLHFHTHKDVKTPIQEAPAHIVLLGSMHTLVFMRFGLLSNFYGASNWTQGILPAKQTLFHRGEALPSFSVVEVRFQKPSQTMVSLHLISRVGTCSAPSGPLSIALWRDLKWLYLHISSRYCCSGDILWWPTLIAFLCLDPKILLVILWNIGWDTYVSEACLFCRQMKISPRLMASAS